LHIVIDHTDKETHIMEDTFQPSLPHFRNRITAIEAIELAAIGFVFWGLITLIPTQTGDFSIEFQVVFFFITEVVILGSWAIYNIYIRISRAGGRYVDHGLWIGTLLLTGSYSLWCWIILDVNRFILAKLLYRGEAPVEYAVSWRSKQRRKLWEQMQKASRPELYP
jgi:hypothetical protein